MTNNVSGKLQIPAIGMIVGSTLNALVGLVVTVSGLFRYTVLLHEEEPLPADMAEKIGFLTATIAGYGAGLLSLIFAPFIFYGAKMSILPVSCCFPLTIIFGVWAFVVLLKPEVKAVFQSGAQKNALPPPPPQAW
jgi:hypothetical protein